MLSSIFLVSRSIDPNATLPYSQVELDERVREPRLTTPRFSGRHQRWRHDQPDAADMRPNLTDPTSGTATDLRAQLVTPDGDDDRHRSPRRQRSTRRRAPIG